MHRQQQQFINLFALLLLGAFFSNLYLSWWEIVAILLFTLLFDLSISSCGGGVPTREMPFSSLATAIGVILMMVSTHFYIYFVVIALALLQKHCLKIEIFQNVSTSATLLPHNEPRKLTPRHFFNPSNFAIIMALLFFYKDAHIVLGQLGDAPWLALLLTLMAVAILIRVNRWIIPLSFIFFYLIFEYLWVVRLDPVLIMEEVYYRFYSISFILFILFMLTDPKTTPSKNIHQLLFSLGVAMLSVGLDYLHGYRVQHLFLSLFFFSLFTPLVEGWGVRSRSVLFITFMVATLATGAIITIESKPPFYFTMDD